MVAWIMAILLGASIVISIDRVCKWLLDEVNKNDNNSADN